MSNEAVCRTAPATPGLLKKYFVCSSQGEPNFTYKLVKFQFYSLNIIFLLSMAPWFVYWLQNHRMTYTMSNRPTLAVSGWYHGLELNGIQCVWLFVGSPFTGKYPHEMSLRHHPRPIDVSLMHRYYEMVLSFK